MVHVIKVMTEISAAITSSRYTRTTSTTENICKLAYQCMKMALFAWLYVLRCTAGGRSSFFAVCSNRKQLKFRSAYTDCRIDGMSKSWQRITAPTMPKWSHHSFIRSSQIFIVSIVYRQNATPPLTPKKYHKLDGWLLCEVASPSSFNASVEQNRSIYYIVINIVSVVLIEYVMMGKKKRRESEWWALSTRLLLKHTKFWLITLFRMCVLW